MSEGYANGETGEIFSTSQAAISAARDRLEKEEAAYLGTGKLCLHAALMAAVSKMPVWVTTDKDNPAFKRDGKTLKYASLKQILETVRPHLHEQGIRIRQGCDRSWPNDEGGGVKGRLIPVFTDLIHAKSGEVERTVIEIPLSRMDPQGMGIAVAYGRRYTLLAGLGLATDEADDDGEGAVMRGITERVQQSSDLLVLLKELEAFKSATDLAEWGHDKKQTQRLNRLTETERAVAHQAYNNRADALLNAPADETPSPKKGAK